MGDTEIEFELDERGIATLEKLQAITGDSQEEVVKKAIMKELKRLKSDRARRQWLTNELERAEANRAGNERRIAALDALMGESIEIAILQTSNPDAVIAHFEQELGHDELTRLLAAAKRRGILWRPRPAPGSKPT